MKRGLIVYTAGEAPASWTVDNERIVKNAIPGVEAVEIITSQTGHFDVMDAWWFLKARGMAHVECKIAIFTEDGKLKDTGRTLRLCG